MGENTPSENEWAIMEVVWNHEGSDITASDIIERLSDDLSISPKTIRVMINRLLSKGVLGYTVDEKDARVYHYYAKMSRDECLERKSERFVKHYFRGDAAQAVASFIRTSDITKEQLKELRDMIDRL